MDELLTQPLTWPCFAGRRILIVGAGWGCDILVAYALATMFRAHAPAEVIYATAKSRIWPGLERIGERVYSLPSEPEGIGAAAAAPRIEELVPRGERGCPLILHVPPGAADAGLAAQIRALGVDGLIGVDTGGDSLIENALSGPDGRDRRMLRVLRTTGLPLIHVVVAPGSDGEATADQIAAAFRQLSGERCYLGCFDLRPLVPLLRQLAARLAPERTPNIIAAAEAQQRRGVTQTMTVARGLRPQIRLPWLLHGFAFAWHPWR